jgi:hypothetical protein
MSGSRIGDIYTPKKERIKGAAEFMDAMGIGYYKTDLFNFLNVSRQQGYAILAEHDQADKQHDSHMIHIWSYS